jgi:hypothetical protein
VFLVNSRHPLFTAPHFGSDRENLHLMWVPLLPKLRGYFAEFLNQGYLTRLRILTLPTCVGLRYGHQTNSLRGFSRKHGIGHLRPKRPRHQLSALTRSRICLGSPPTTLNRDFQHPDGLPFSVPPSLKRLFDGTGILTCFPSPTPFDLGLGTD